MDTILEILHPVFATAIIVGVAIAIYFILKTINQMFPQAGEKIMNATPWMGWSEPEQDETVPYRPFDRYV